MGKYSSDSEYEKHSSKKSVAHKSSRRRRSDSSDSSESRTSRRRRDTKSTIKQHRSKSRDRYSKSRRSRSSSRSYKSSSYKTKSSHRRKSRSKSYERYKRQDKYRSRRSRSRSYIKEYNSKDKDKSRRSSSSSSSSSSCEVISAKKKISEKTKLAVSEVKIENLEIAQQVSSEVLEEINNDSFEQKAFTSKKVSESIVIDLTKQTIKVPKSDKKKVELDSIFHHNLFQSEEVRMEKWVKELYSYRQKALQQGTRNN